jgi:hypothetical protein
MKFSIWTNAEVRNGVDADRDVVLGDDLLRGNRQRDRAQIDLDHPVDDGNQQEQTGPLRLRQQAAEPEHDAALVLPSDLDRREEKEDDQQNEDRDDDQCGVHRLDPMRCRVDGP